ncbi:hypothetical protein ACHAXR_006695 [Thalassiosira sp. AJA248-18]
MAPSSKKPSRALFFWLAVSSLVISNANVIFCTAFQLPSPSIRKNANPQPCRAAAAASKSRILPLRMSSSGSSSSSSNIPSEEEIVRQKQEAYNALSSFHETSYSLTQSSSTQIKSLLKDLDTIGINNGEDDEGEQTKPVYWRCSKGAITYSVPMDPAAGLKRGVISKPYKCSVQVEMDLGELRGGGGGGGGGGNIRRRGLRLVESIQFGNSDKEDDSALSSLPFVRSLPLGANVDVDAVDGSYSLDDAIPTTTDQGRDSVESPSLPLLPPSLLVGVVDPTAVQFLVEHTLAVSETERCRCFLLYGDATNARGGGDDDGEDGNDVGDNDGEEDDFAILAAKKAKAKDAERSYRLLGVVLAEETKVMPEQTTEGKESGDDAEDDYASDFISQMIEASPSESPASPLDLLEINQPESEDDKLERLMQSLDKHNERVMESAMEGATSGDNAKMERHSLGMFGLTSGVWLGDTFVRETIPSRLLQSRQKGFGKKSETLNKVEEDRFATWQMGVQKIALHFKWDYDSSVTQSYTYGKVMGTATSLSSMANIKSDGVVAVNDARRRKKREERRVVWDMDGGAYVAGLIGSCYFRAPRYMSFYKSRSYSADPYLTEFMVFYRPESKALDAEMDTDAVPEYYCSRTSRLYNANDGSLMQGATAFFAMKQPLLDSLDQ